MADSEPARALDPSAHPPPAASRRTVIAATVVVAAVLVLCVAAPLWWGDSAVARWLSIGAALALAAASLLLLRQQARQARANAQALDRFAQCLREGDVPGALRAVRAEGARAITAWGALDADAEAPSQLSVAPSSLLGGAAPSRFDRSAREVELALGERERRWQARMRLSADWHWETDAELTIAWVSQDLASLVKLGVQPSDLIGHRLDAVPVFESPAGGWEPILDRIAQRKALRDITLEVKRRGLSPVWITLNGRAHFDDQGVFTGYEGVGRDVTEQRLAHERLAASERRHAMMAELAADWYWQTDADHRLTEVGRQILGSRADKVIGRHRWSVFRDGASESEWAAHRADLEAHRPFRGFEFAMRGANRTLRWVSISGTPRFDAQGAFLGFHGVGRDITLKKRAERLLLTRNEQLERLVAERTAELEQTNRDLEAFARQLAHELRTPIGQVVGLSDLLKSSAWNHLSDNEREWLRLSGQAARDMSHTVTALLELARSTSTALLLEPVDLSALAESVIADLPWIERRAEPQWTIEPGLVAHCSAALARVVLSNLLGNAAKFTRDMEAPRIEFGRAGEQGEGAFFVQDNGAGFDAEQAATLFQPFVRLHRSEQFQGTGLGLSIVRRIVERHGGGVSATGGPGQGARFVFRFGPPRATDMQLPLDAARDAAA